MVRAKSLVSVKYLEAYVWKWMLIVRCMSEHFFLIFEPNTHDFCHYREKQPGFVLTWQCRVSGLVCSCLSLSWLGLGLTVAQVSDCCLTCFSLSPGNTLCDKGPTAPGNHCATNNSPLA